MEEVLTAINTANPGIQIPMRTNPTVVLIVGTTLGFIGILIVGLDLAKHRDGSAIQVGCYAVLAFLIAYLGHRRRNQT